MRWCAGRPNGLRVANRIAQLGIGGIPTGCRSSDPLRFAQEILKSRGQGAASIRSAMIGRFLEEARSTSLPTCEEAIELSDKTRTRALALVIARMQDFV